MTSANPIDQTSVCKVPDRKLSRARALIPSFISWGKVPVPSHGHTRSHSWFHEVFGSGLSLPLIELLVKSIWSCGMDRGLWIVPDRAE